VARRLLPAAATLLLACVPAAVDRVDYPASLRVAQADDYHGQQVADPYRWLEEVDAPDTAAWIEAQNAVTAAHVGTLPGREHFVTRVRALIDYERFGVPRREGATYAYRYNSGLQDQDTLWVTDDPARRGRLLLDPNVLSADGTISLADDELAPDGLKLAYALSDGGTDWKTWRVRDVATARDHPEVLRGTKFTNVAWARDSSGFFYSRYPEKAGGGHDDGRQVTIWFHALGTEQAADRFVYAITDHPTRDPYPTVTEDGGWLVINVQEGYQTNGVYFAPLGPGHTAGEVVRLHDRWDALYEFLGNDGPVFYFQTTNAAPAGRIIAVDTRRPEPGDWREVVPQRAEAIAAASLVGGRLVVQYIVDVKSVVRVFDRGGRLERELALPGAGSTEGFAGHATDPETFFIYTDFMTPRAVYRLDVASGATTLLQAPRAGIEPADYVTRQVHYESRDGTPVPMYVVHRRDRPPDGRRPAVLYGYGGFNVSLLPAYSATRAAWIEAGGVYAVANLRGGGEFGEAWHEAGTKLRKQNVFDDFIAAAEWLIREGYTQPEQLAIWGGSNGGLLVGAVLNQRPELFGAAVPAVGVMDMLRYHLASANARQWSSDYGLSEVREEFRALRAYSPYHNLREGACYPPTLVIADVNDDRVSPWHSFKYAAALQAAQGCANPVLIRIETRAGHGAGASTSKIVEQYADQWAFVADALGLEVPSSPPPTAASR
jgi:prolyl oligopeptidase